MKYWLLYNWENGRDWLEVRRNDGQVSQSLFKEEGYGGKSDKFRGERGILYSLAQVYCWPQGTERSFPKNQHEILPECNLLF